MPNTEKEKARFLKAFPKCGRKISETCRQLKMSRRTVTHWATVDPKFREALEDTGEDQIDEVEGSLMQMCMGYTKKLKRQKVTASGEIVEYEVEIYIPKNIAAIKYFLDSQAKHRGYGRKLADPDEDDDLADNEPDEDDLPQEDI